MNKYFAKLINRVIIILVVIFLLIFTLGYLKNIHRNMDLLVKRNHSLELKNKKLENAIVYQYEQILELRNVQIETTKQPIQVEQPIHKQKQEKLNDDAILDGNVTFSTITTTILISIMSAGKIVTSYIPAFP